MATDIAISCFIPLRSHSTIIAPAKTLPTIPATPASVLLERPSECAPTAALEDDDAELEDVEDVDEELLLEDDDGVAVATVRVCPAKEVVIPDSVARVTTGPPEEVTSTTGTPLTAVERCGVKKYVRRCFKLHLLAIVANTWDVAVPRAFVASSKTEEAASAIDEQTCRAL